MPISVDEVATWFHQCAGSTVAIWCEDPETNKEYVGGGLIERTYFTYRILMKLSGRDIVGVRHRYSEFESLRTILRDRYTPLGIFVPALPPKKAMSSLLSTADTIFIKERTRGLSLFCEAVASIPFLRHDTTWKNFMKPTAASIDHNEENHGENYLVVALMHLEVPFKYTMQQRLAELREEVNQVERQAQYFLEKVRALQAAKRSVIIAAETVHEALASWASVEDKFIHTLNGKPFEATTSILADKDQVSYILDTSSKLLGAKSDALRDGANQDGVLVAAALEHEVSRMESIRELLRVHDEMVHSIDTITSKLSRLEDKKVTSGDAVAELKLMLDEKQTCLAAFYKGLVYFTLPLCSKLRSHTFKRAFTYLGVGMLCSHSKIAAEADIFFSELDINFADAFKEATQTLDLLSLRPFSAPPLAMMESTLGLPLSKSTAVCEDIYDRLLPKRPIETDNHVILAPPTRGNPLVVQKRPASASSNQHHAESNDSHVEVFDDFESQAYHAPPQSQAAAASGVLLTSEEEPRPDVIFKTTIKSKSILDDLVHDGGNQSPVKVKDSVWDD